MLHDKRITEVYENDENEEFFPEDFSRLLKVLKKKPEKYQHILKAGSTMKQLIYNIYKWIWEHEVRPEKW